MLAVSLGKRPRDPVLFQKDRRPRGNTRDISRLPTDLILLTLSFLPTRDIARTILAGKIFYNPFRLIKQESGAVTVCKNQMRGRKHKTGLHDLFQYIHLLSLNPAYYERTQQIKIVARYVTQVFCRPNTLDHELIPLTTTWTHTTALNLLNCASLSDKSLQLIKRLPLKELCLHHCSGITDAGLVHLSDSLTQLDLSCTRISNSGLEHLKTLKKLRQLDISRCSNVNDVGMAHLKDLPIEDLDISYCERITGRGVLVLPRLKGLTLVGCNQVNREWISFLSALPITELNFSWCNKIDDLALKVLKYLPYLVTIDFWGCPKITHEGTRFLAALRSLRSLCIARCTKVDDRALAHFKNGKLERLNISENDAVTDAGLEHLKNLPLTDLDISLSKKITAQGLRCLSQLPLKRLRAAACSHITFDIIKSVFPQANLEF